MLSLLLPLLAVVDGPTRFAAPERLLADGRPINAEEGMLYPSPVLFDVDGDGQDELVCGDLWGHLWVHESAAEAGEPAWLAPEKLKSADGEVLKVPNW